MTLYNIFNTFEEASSAQEYDFNLFKAKKFAEKTGIDLDIILDLGLHLDQELRHQYYVDHAIIFTDEQKASIHDLINYFNCTNRWANISLHNDAYIYIVCPDSDVVRPTIELSLEQIKSLKSLNDDGVYIPATDWSE